MAGRRMTRVEREAWEEAKRKRREELGIKLPEPLPPWGSKDTLSKQVIPYFERGEHPLMVAKKLGVNPTTVSITTTGCGVRYILRL